jgi:hypothetical protein
MYWTRLEPEDERSRLRKLVGGGVGFQLAYVMLDLPSQQNFFLGEWLASVGASPLILDVGRLDLRGRDSIDLSLQAMAKSPDAPVAVLMGLDSFLCADGSDGNNTLLRRLVQPLVMGRERLRDTWPKPILILLSKRGADRLDEEAPDLATWTPHRFMFPPPLELMLAEIEFAIAARTEAPAKRLSKFVFEHPRTKAGRNWTERALSFVRDLESLEDRLESIDEALGAKVRKCLPTVKRMLASRPAAGLYKTESAKPPRGREAAVLACAVVRKDVSRKLTGLLGGTHRIVAVWGPPEAAKGLMADGVLRSFDRSRGQAGVARTAIVKVSGLHWGQAQQEGLEPLAPFVESTRVTAETLKEVVIRLASNGRVILVIDEFERTADQANNPLCRQIDDALEAIVKDHTLNATALLICDSEGFSAFTRLERWSADPIPSRNRIHMDGFAASERTQFLILTEGLGGHDAARLAEEAQSVGSLMALRLAGRFVRAHGPLAGETGDSRPIETRADAYLQELISSLPLMGRDTRRLLFWLADGSPATREDLAKKAGVSARRTGTILNRLRREGLVEMAPTRREHKWVGVFWVRGRFLRDRFRALGAKTSRSNQVVELENARRLFRSHGIPRLTFNTAVRLLAQRGHDSEARRIARDSLLDKLWPVVVLLIPLVSLFVGASMFWFRSSVERDYAERILIKRGVLAGTTCLDTGLVARDFVPESIPKLNTFNGLAMGAGQFLERQISLGGVRNQGKLFPLAWAGSTEAANRISLLTREPAESQDVVLRANYVAFGTADPSFYQRLWHEAFAGPTTLARRLVRDTIRTRSFIDLGLEDVAHASITGNRLSDMDRRALYQGARLGQGRELPTWLRELVARDATKGEDLGIAAQLLLLRTGGVAEACRLWDDLVDRLERPNRPFTWEVTLLTTECAIASRQEARALTALSFALTRPVGANHAETAIRFLVARPPEVASIAAQRVLRRWPSASVVGRLRLAQTALSLSERDEELTRGFLDRLLEQPSADTQAMDLMILLSSRRPKLLSEKGRRAVVDAINSRNDTALADDFLSTVRKGGQVSVPEFCTLFRDLSSASVFSGTPSCGVAFVIQDLRVLLGNPGAALSVRVAAMRWAAAQGGFPILDLLQGSRDAEWLPLAEAVLSSTTEPTSLAQALAREGLDRLDTSRDKDLLAGFGSFAISLGRHLKWQELEMLGVSDRLRSTDRDTRGVAVRFLAGVLLSARPVRNQITAWATALEAHSCSIAGDAGCREAVRIATEVGTVGAGPNVISDILAEIRTMNDDRILANRVLAAELIGSSTLRATLEASLALGSGNQ